MGVNNFFLIFICGFYLCSLPSITCGWRSILWLEGTNVNVCDLTIMSWICWTRNWMLLVVLYVNKSSWKPTLKCFNIWHVSTSIKVMDLESELYGLKELNCHGLDAKVFCYILFVFVIIFLADAWFSSLNSCEVDWWSINYVFYLWSLIKSGCSIFISLMSNIHF